MGAEIGVWKGNCTEEQVECSGRCSSINGGTLTVGKTYWGLARPKQRSSVSSDVRMSEEAERWE